MAVISDLVANNEAYAASFEGLENGDAHVIRNAGGRASDDEFAVIHHTDCGMPTFTNEAMVEKLGAEAAKVDFLTFPDLEQSVRDHVGTGKLLAVS